jgi:hypothetical protein
MSRPLIVGAYATRLPALRESVLRPPALRLVLPDRDRAWHPIAAAAPSVAPQDEPSPTPPAHLDEEDVERWDGLG